MATTSPETWLINFAGRTEVDIVRFRALPLRHMMPRLPVLRDLSPLLGFNGLEGLDLFSLDLDPATKVVHR